MHHAEGQRGAVMAILHLSVYAPKATDDTLLFHYNDKRMAVAEPSREAREVARGKVFLFVELIDFFARFSICLVEKPDIAPRQGVVARHAELAFGNEEVPDSAKHGFSFDA